MANKNSYKKQVTAEITKFIIPVIAEIISDYLIPSQLTDYYIGLCDLCELADEIEDYDECICGAVEGRSMFMIEESIENGAWEDLGLQKAIILEDAKFIDYFIDKPKFLGMGVYEAAKRNKIPLLERILSKWPYERKYNKACAGAAAGGHETLMNQMILLGGDINSAVSSAAESNHATLVNKLLQRGADILNATMGAACGNNIELMNNLIERGGTLRAAAVGACANKNHDLARSLIARGARRDVVFRIACSAGDADFAREMLTPDMNILPMIHSACISRSKKVMLIFIERDIHPSIFLEGMLRMSRQKRIVKWLVSIGADPKAYYPIVRPEYISLLEQLAHQYKN